MKKIFILLALTAIVITAIGILFKRAQNNQLNFNIASQKENLKDIKVGGITLKVEIASTESQRIQGLSDRDKLEEGRGMLFVFAGPDIRAFWMKGMKFSLDFIWINHDKIVQIDKNIPIPSPETPDDSLTKYVSGVPVTHVLEVSAGFAEKNNIKVGDSVDLSKI